VQSEHRAPDQDVRACVRACVCVRAHSITSHVYTSAADRVLTNSKTLNQLVCSRPCRLDTCACYFLQESCGRQRHLGDRKDSRDRPAAVPGMPPVSQPSVASHSQQQATGTNLCASSLISYKLTTGLNAVLACELAWIKNEVA